MVNLYGICVLLLYPLGTHHIVSGINDDGVACAAYLQKDLALRLEKKLQHKSAPILPLLYLIIYKDIIPFQRFQRDESECLQSFAVTAVTLLPPDSTDQDTVRLPA